MEATSVMIGMFKTTQPINGLNAKSHSRPEEVLSSLPASAQAKTIQWDFGGLGNIRSTEVLRPSLHGAIDEESQCLQGCTPLARETVQEDFLRTMRVESQVARTSSRSRLYERRAIESRNAMRKMPWRTSWAETRRAFHIKNPSEQRGLCNTLRTTPICYRGQTRPNSGRRITASSWSSLEFDSPE